MSLSHIQIVLATAITAFVKVAASPARIMVQCLHKNALAMLDTSESVARINQRLRRIDPSMSDSITRNIPLSKGKVALVDAEDYGRVSPFKWRAQYQKRWNRWYAVRKEKGLTVLMHRCVLDVPSNMQVDHRNRDGLDNRRTNLRAATSSQNQYNAGLRVDNKSGFKGVSFDRCNQRWRAHIRTLGKSMHLGCFASAEDAARVYDAKAVELRGEFARINFPQEATNE